MSKLQLITFLFLNLFCMGSGFAQPSHLDSLYSKCEEMRNDTEKVRKLNALFLAYNNKSYLNDKALGIAKDALDISKKLNFNDGIITAYLNLGIYYSFIGDNKQALDNNLLALDIAEKNNYKSKLGDVYSQLAGFYTEKMKNYPKALEYAEKGLKVLNDIGCRNHIMTSLLINTGNIYYGMNNDTLALRNYLEALDIVTASNDTDYYADIENNLGSVYNDLKIYDKAIECYTKALNIYQKMKDNDDIAMSYLNIADVLNSKGNTDEGIQYATNALAIARKVNDKKMISYSYNCLADIYSKTGDYQKAYQYQSALSGIKDTLFSEAGSKQVNDMQVKYDTEKKEKENKILELNINRQKLVNYSITVGLILVTVLVFFIYRGYVNQKKAHEELAEKNKIIEEKNKDILDSINYAKTIQTAILTPDEYLYEELKDYFIVYKPRDVVSGDFYWCHSRENKVIFAVADCTGHGVPGAFMSMIGNSLLNEVVIENKITDAGQILNDLRTNLLKTLVQKGKHTVTDGMDIALCVWDKNANTLQFAGANNPMYLIRSGLNGSVSTTERVKIHGDILAEFLPDKQPIGQYETKTDSPFHSQTVQLQKGDMVYISSDGYVDQFGGDKNKKFTSKQFRDLLCTLTGKGLEEQKLILESTIENWKGSYAQTDDICLMGVKFS